MTNLLAINQINYIQVLFSQIRFFCKKVPLKMYLVPQFSIFWVLLFRVVKWDHFDLKIWSNFWISNLEIFHRNFTKFLRKNLVKLRWKISKFEIQKFDQILRSKWSHLTTLKRRTQNIENWGTRYILSGTFLQKNLIWENSTCI